MPLSQSPFTIQPMHSAFKVRTFLDRSLTFVSIVSFAVPSFLLCRLAKRCDSSWSCLFGAVASSRLGSLFVLSCRYSFGETGFQHISPNEPVL